MLALATLGRRSHSVPPDLSYCFYTELRSQRPMKGVAGLGMSMIHDGKREGGLPEVLAWWGVGSVHCDQLA